MSKYIYKGHEFLLQQYKEIEYGLKEGLDVDIYAKPEYSWGQMQEIRIGLLNNIDVTTYLSPDTSEYIMCQTRKELMFQKFEKEVLKPILDKQTKEMKEMEIAIKKFSKQDIDMKEIVVKEGIFDRAEKDKINASYMNPRVFSTYFFKGYKNEKEYHVRIDTMQLNNIVNVIVSDDERILY